jgi:hypothetical protein
MGHQPIAQALWHPCAWAMAKMAIPRGIDYRKLIVFYSYYHLY